MASPVAPLLDVHALMERVDAGDVYLELWHGQLQRQAAQRLSHSRAATKIAVSMAGFDDDDGPGGWWIAVEVHWRIDRTTAVVVDVAWLAEGTLTGPTGRRGSGSTGLGL